MRVLGYIFLTLVCLVLMLGTFLFVAAPVNVIRDQVVAAVKRETGRDLVIRGDTSFAFYPNLGVALEDVELSAPPEMGGPSFLKVGSMKLAMPMLALLQRRVSIDEFVLERPEIDLRVDERGQQSWAFARSGSPRSGSSEQSDLSPELKEFIDNSSNSDQAGQAGGDDVGDDGGSGIAGLRLGDVRIVDGIVRYADARSGMTETVSNVNLVVALEALDAPLSVNGSAVWNGKRVPVEATVTTLDALISKRPARVVLSAAPKDLTLGFDGTYDQSGKGTVNGQLKLNSANVAEFSSWLSGQKDASNPIKSVAINGGVSGNGDALSIKNAKFTVNDLSGTGAVSVRFSGRMRVDGDVSVGAIRTASFRAGSKAPATGAGGQSVAAQSDGRWNEDAIDFKPLRSLDANLRVSYQSLVHEDIQLGSGAAAISLNQGVLRVKADRISIYDGVARGGLTVDAREAVARYSARIAAERISALPLLKALADFDWLSGATSARIDVSGRGQSQRQMMRTMNGATAFNFADGAIEGLNVAKIMRGVQQGRFKDFDRVPGEKTDFSALTASFKITEGVAHNADLSLIGPLVRATGNGIVNLGAQTLDYRLTPKLVASLEGQGGSDATGLEIPLLIRGPWKKPGIAPDLNSVLKNPEAAAKSIDGLVKKARSKVKSKKVKDLLDGVLGGGEASDGEKKPLGGLLGDLLQ